MSVRRGRGKGPDEVTQMGVVTITLKGGEKRNLQVKVRNLLDYQTTAPTH